MGTRTLLLSCSGLRSLLIERVHACQPCRWAGRHSARCRLHIRVVDQQLLGMHFCFWPELVDAQAAGVCCLRCPGCASIASCCLMA